MLDHEAKMAAAVIVLAAAERAAKNVAPRHEDTAYAMTAQEKSARAAIALVQLALPAVRVHHPHPSIEQTYVAADATGVSPGTPCYTTVTWSSVAGARSGSDGDIVLRVSGCDSHTGASPAGKGPRFAVILCGEDEAEHYYGVDGSGAVRDVIRALISRELSDASPAPESVSAATALIKGDVPAEPAAVDNAPTPPQGVPAPLDTAKVGMIVSDSVQRLKKRLADEAAEVAEKRRVRELARSRRTEAAEAVGTAVAEAVSSAGFILSVQYIEGPDMAVAEFTPVKVAMCALCDREGVLLYRARSSPARPWSEATPDVYKIIALCADAIFLQALGRNATQELV